MNDNFFLSRFLRHLKYFLIKNFYPYTALNDLDKKMKNFLNYENGYFLEIGANDGFRQSNTYYFEKKLNWKGILIEPNSENFIECKKNRSDRNKFYQVACVENNKKKTIDMFYTDLMTTSFKNKRNNNYYKSNFDLSKSYKFSVKAETLKNILKRARAPKKIDFFSLDVEGLEMNVLKGIDFKKNYFNYILIETYKFEKVKKFLNNKNYHFLKKLSVHDYLFKLNKNKMI